MIIETCPKCGHDLVSIVLTSNPPIPKKECWNCGWSWTGEPEEVTRVPFGGNRLDVEESYLMKDTYQISDYKIIDDIFKDASVKMIKITNPFG